MKIPVFNTTLFRGDYPGKAWIISKKEDIRTEKPDGTKLEWWFHVAPTLNVRITGKKTEKLIFDPGLFDGPAHPEEWLGKLNTGAHKFHMVEYDEIPPGCTGDYSPNDKTRASTDGDAAKLMAEYLEEQEPGKRVVFASEERKQSIHRLFSGKGSLKETFQKFAEEHLQGETWISETIYKKPELSAALLKPEEFELQML